MDQGIVETLEDEVEVAVEDFIMEMIAGVEVDDKIMFEIIERAA